MPRIRWARCVAGLVAIAAMPQAAAGQQPVPAVAVAPAPRVPLGPTLEAAQFGVRDDAPAALVPNAAASRVGRREGRVLAIVGGAAVITGVIIGDTPGTVIAVSGAVIGLYGLYEWQR